eukprot:540469_1
MSTEVSSNGIVDLVLLSLGVIIQSIVYILWIITIYCPSATISFGGHTQDDKSTSQVSPTGSAKSIPNLQNQTSATSAASNDTNIQTSNHIETAMYNNTQKRKKKAFKHDKQIPLIFKVLTTLSLFCGLIALLYFNVNHILELYIGYPGTCFSRNMPVIAVTIERLTLYLYYIYRIEVTFKDSVFSISETKLNIFKVTIIIMGVIAATFYMVFVEINQCEGRLIGLIPFVIIDIVISTTTFVLFINRLKKLIAKSNTNLKLKRMIKKLSILLCVTILSTIGAMGLYVIVPHVQIGCGTIGLWAIDTVINSLCLLLSYVFFNKYYNRLCFVCIKCVEIISKLDKSDTTNECDISPHVEI